MPRVVTGGYHPTVPTMAWPDPTSQYAQDTAAMRLVVELERVGWDVPGWECTLRVYGAGDERRVYLSEVEGHIGGDPFVLRFDLQTGAAIGDGFHAHRSLSMAALPQFGGQPAMRVDLDADGVRAIQVYSGVEWREAMRRLADGALSAYAVQDYERREHAFYPVVSFETCMEPMATGYVPCVIQRDEVTRHTADLLRRAADRLAVQRTARVPVSSLCGECPELLSEPGTWWLLTTKVYVHRIGARSLEPFRRWVAWPNRPLLLEGDRTADTANVLDAAWRPKVRLVAERPDPADPRWLALFRCGLRRPPYLVRASVGVANDAWVADLAAGDDARARAFEGRSVLSDLDAAEVRVAVARTMVPLRAYRGNHRRPCLLLERELRIDEVGGVETT